MSKYNHITNELELLQRIANITALILTLRENNKISEEVYNELMKVVTNE